VRKFLSKISTNDFFSLAIGVFVISFIVAVISFIFLAASGLTAGYVLEGVIKSFALGLIVSLLLCFLFSGVRMIVACAGAILVLSFLEGEFESGDPEMEMQAMREEAESG